MLNKVNRLCSLFIKEKFTWSSNLENSLNTLAKSTSFLTPAIVSEVLQRNRDHALLAWNFYNWVNHLEITGKDLVVFKDVSSILCNAKLIEELKHLHQSLAKPENRESSSAPKLAILAESLAKAGFVHEAFAAYSDLKQFDAKLTPSFYNALMEASIGKGKMELIPILYKEMIRNKVKPDAHIFHMVIRGLCEAGKIVDALGFFRKIATAGYSPNSSSLEILVKAMCQTSRFAQALNLFDELKRSGFVPDVILYEIIIKGLCEQKSMAVAEDLVQRMAKEGPRPTGFTYICLISGYCKLGETSKALEMLHHAERDVEASLGIDTYNSVLDALCKEGKLDQAFTLLQHMKTGSMISYSIVLQEMVKQGKIFSAVDLLRNMGESGTSPDVSLFNMLIDTMCDHEMLCDAEEILTAMKESMVKPNLETYNLLIKDICKHGDFAKALSLLDRMTRKYCGPDLATYFILIESMCRVGRISEVERVVEKMRETGVLINTVTCNVLIEGYCRSGEIDKAIAMLEGLWLQEGAQTQTPSSGCANALKEKREAFLPNVGSYSIIIDFLCKASRLDDAKMFFNQMLEKGVSPDSIIYGILIDSLAKAGEVKEAFMYVKEMETTGCVPTTAISNSLLCALTSMGEREMACRFIDYLEGKDYKLDALSYSIVMRSLCECGVVLEVQAIMCRMLRSGFCLDASLLSTLAEGFCQIGNVDEAWKLLKRTENMCSNPNGISAYRAVFNKLCELERLSEAQRLFSVILQKRFDLSGFSYVSMISHLCQKDMLKEAMSVINRLKVKGCLFDPEAYDPLIEAFIDLRKLHYVKNLQDERLKMVLSRETAQEGENTGLKDAHPRRLWKRDEGSQIAIKTLILVLKGWGKGPPQDFSMFAEKKSK